MKLCVYGLGAIGGYLATKLASLDKEIALCGVDRDVTIAAIEKNGLQVMEQDNIHHSHFPVSDDPKSLVQKMGKQDCVLIALKAHQAWRATEDIASLLAPDGFVVTCQNGVPWWYFATLPAPWAGRRLQSIDPEDRQWRAIGPANAVGCVVYPAAELLAPGKIRHIYGNKFALGEVDGQISPRCQKLSAIFEKAGLKAPVLEDIRSEIWLKLWGNLCFNPLSALTRATLDILATHPDTRSTAYAMMREGEKIAVKLGAKFRVDIERRINGAAKIGAHRTSMLQDLEAGRPMEIDALVSAVQEMGRICEIETPILDCVLGMVRQLGRSKKLYPVFDR